MRHKLKWLLTKLHWLPSEPFLRLAYWLETGRKLNLRQPVTFCDKLNYIKLHGGTSCYAPLVERWFGGRFCEPNLLILGTVRDH